MCVVVHRPPGQYSLCEVPLVQPAVLEGQALAETTRRRDHQVNDRLHEGIEAGNIDTGLVMQATKLFVTYSPAAPLCCLELEDVIFQCTRAGHSARITPDTHTTGKIIPSGTTPGALRPSKIRQVRWIATKQKNKS